MSSFCAGLCPSSRVMLLGAMLCAQNKYISMLMGTNRFLDHQLVVTGILVKLASSASGSSFVVLLTNR